jgi:hypothetical protein
MSALAAELEGIDLGDRRLNRRARKVLTALGDKPTVSIPAACGGWEETRGAYRLFNHKKVTAQQLLAPHYRASQQRMGEHPRVLCIQDTTELDYSRKGDIEGLGPLNYEARQGLTLHPTIAVTPERLCLGAIDAWTWTREPGSLGADKKSCRLIEDKESLRWLEGYRRVCERQAELPATELIYLADREADIYEIYAESQAQSTAAHWLIRSQHDRKLLDGRTLRKALAEAPILDWIEFDLPKTEKRKAQRITQSLRAVRVKLKAPYRPGGLKLPHVEVTALLAQELDPPAGAEPVEWLLLSSLPVTTAAEARELLRLYLCRWQVEIYFRILKSGCKIEKLQLEKLERLEPALAFYMIIAWRVLYLTMLGRQCPELPCDVVFAEEEWKAVYVVAKRQPPPEQPPSLDEMVRMVAGFGGFLNRKGDGFPGPQTIWIGLQRSRDFATAIAAHKATLASISTLLSSPNIGLIGSRKKRVSSEPSVISFP